MPYRRETRRTYLSALRTAVKNQPVPDSRPFPLTHITDALRLRSILETGELRPRSCRVFGDKRLYVFYARPAYRGGKSGPLHNLNFAPIGFLISPAVARERAPLEVFPFDTGALEHGLLAEDIHPDLTPFDLALEPVLDSAQRLAVLFFGSEKCYFQGRRSREAVTLRPRPTDADLIAYESLVTRGANLARDERATSIEFQFKESVSIRGKVLAIILPQDFLDDEETRRFLLDANVEPLPYEFIPDHSPKEYVGVFYREAAAFYERSKQKHGWDWA